MAQWQEQRSRCNSAKRNYRRGKKIEHAPDQLKKHQGGIARMLLDNEVRTNLEKYTNN